MNTGLLRSERAGIAAVIVLLVVAFPTLLIWGEGQWFFLDEWSFLANRKLPSLDGFLADHNGHWVTLPLVAYRVNFELFGLRTYLPYQVLVVLSHLAIAFLGHIVMRRIGVNAWLATAVMVGFVFYGTGWANIIFGFQIALNGSIIAGLVVLLLADRDGGWSRRDSVAVGVSILGLMTSATFPALAVGVGAFVLARGRGLKVAALHTLIPAAVFLLWFFTFGEASEVDPELWRVLTFAYHMVFGSLEGLAGGTVGGILLAGVLGLGLWRAMQGRDEHDTTFAFAVGLPVAAVTFATLTGFSRAAADLDIATAATQGRYLYVCMGLLIPLVALGAQQLWEWRRPAVLVPLIVIALGLPDAIDLIRNRPPFTTGSSLAVTATAHSPFVDEVPDGHKPFPLQELRAGWMADAAAAGDIPGPPDDLPPTVRLDADAALVIASAPTESADCELAEGPLRTDVDAGDQILIGSDAELLLADGDGRSTARRITGGTTVMIQAGPVDLIVRGVEGDTPRVCVVEG